MSTVYLALAICFLTAVSAQKFFGGASSIGAFGKDIVVEYNKRNSPKLPAYDSVGSGAGIRGFFDGTYKVGASDDPLSNVDDARANAAGGKYTIPITLTHYNIMTKKASGLRLTTNQIARLYRKAGAITNWSALKKGLTGKIIPVGRLDTSGTTKVFVDWLSKTETWITPSGVSFCTLDPSFFRADIKCFRGTEGVRAYAARTTNAITYIQTGAGLLVKLRTSAIKNPAGTFVDPTRADPAQSIPRTLPPSDGNWAGVDLLAKSGKNTYPHVSMVYAFAFKNAGANARKLLIFTQSSIAQNLVNTRYDKSLFRLPSSMTKKSVEAAKKIK